MHNNEVHLYWTHLDNEQEIAQFASKNGSQRINRIQKEKEEVMNKLQKAEKEIDRLSEQVIENVNVGSMSNMQLFRYNPN